MSPVCRCLRNVIEPIAVVVGIVGGILVIGASIDTKIEAKINEEEYLSKLSKNLRPFIIFDDTKKIIYDHGALSFIDTLSVEMDEKTGYPKIHVKFKRYFSAPPILQCLGPNCFTFIAQKEELFSWSFTSYAPSTLGYDGEPISDIFKLELLY